MEDKSKKYEGKNSVIEFVEGWDMIQTLGEEKSIRGLLLPYFYYFIFLVRMEYLSLTGYALQP